jgi:hypothetical protein
LSRGLCEDTKRLHYFTIIAIIRKTNRSPMALRLIMKSTQSQNIERDTVKTSGRMHIRMRLQWNVEIIQQSDGIANIILKGENT